MLKFLRCIVAVSLFLLKLAASEDGVVLTSFHVSAQVHSRLAETEIEMVFENNNECSAIHTLTLQLPRSARLTDLLMDLSDGCVLESEVEDLNVAIETFEEFSSDGKPAALLTAWDMTNYKLQVSIPPRGTTNVSLHYEELLFKKLDRVSFQVPGFPGTHVKDLSIDIAVNEPNNRILEFGSDILAEGAVASMNSGGQSVISHYEAKNVTHDSSLPRLVKANFVPSPLPESGLFLSDGECFTHLFNPTGVGSMARKIVFVIDVSGSMTGQKLADAKTSFATMIDMLEERDTLIVQAFSDKGTEHKWGARAATDVNKEKAKSFVNRLETIGGTNLNDAYLDGIERVYDTPDDVAPVLIMLTDGVGYMDGKQIGRNVLAKNIGSKVKIFSLAFGKNADYDLLLGISLQNGGRTIRIYEGFGDATTQMEQFYKEELGSILMSDVDVVYEGAKILQSTSSQFPVLAGGSEILVRGKMDFVTNLDTQRTLRTIVSAKSGIGRKEWPVEYIVVPADGDMNDCRQSFAQARIMELLEYRDAQRALGDELFASNLSRRSLGEINLSFEEEARKIAIDAGLVWPGLTALVTVENMSCEQNTSDVCYSGNENNPQGLESDFDPGSLAYKTSGSVQFFNHTFLTVIILMCLLAFGIFV